jgi:benzoyl-CoA-dihydrodiol lyase
MLALPDDAERAPKITLNEFNFGRFPMVNDQSRLQRRFYEEAAPLEAARAAVRQPLDADEALKLGLVTAAPDDIDWADEIRIAIEERAAMSPDALTGLEANLRFAARKTWPRASSAGSPPGRTGSSTARTPSAKRARSRSTAPARRPAST